MFFLAMRGWSPNLLWSTHLFEVIVFEMKINVLLPIYYFGFWASWTLGKWKFENKTIRFIMMMSF